MPLIVLCEPPAFPAHCSGDDNADRAHFAYDRENRGGIEYMYRRILVPIDGSKTAARGLSEAIRLAKDQGAKLRLLHVVDKMAIIGVTEAGMDPGPVLARMARGGRALLERARKTANKRGVGVDTAFYEPVAKRVADTVLSEAKKWRADLIVMGTHGRRGVRRLVLGSDAEHVVRLAEVPVLLVRGR
jgi:nucleotide-binding universal stress UspA family protein